MGTARLNTFSTCYTEQWHIASHSNLIWAPFGRCWISENWEFKKVNAHGIHIIARNIKFRNCSCKLVFSLLYIGFFRLYSTLGFGMSEIFMRTLLDITFISDESFLLVNKMKGHLFPLICELYSLFWMFLVQPFLGWTPIIREIFWKQAFLTVHNLCHSG